MNDYTLTDFLTDTTNNHWTGRVTPEKITELAPNEIFVFGSNTKGRHGKGAAKDAMKFGAVYGVGFGHRGQTYAFPTKDDIMQPVFLDAIEYYANRLISYAKGTPEFTYLVTPVGCGLASYTPEEIAPLFKECVNIPNIHLPKSFWDILNKQ